MKLIDADALTEAIKGRYCDGCDNYNGVRCRACSTDDALTMIDEAQTVEPVQMVTLSADEIADDVWAQMQRPEGEWKAKLARDRIHYDSVCSVCGYKTAMVLDEWSYCPHCGSFMR